MSRLHRSLGERMPRRPPRSSILSRQVSYHALQLPLLDRSADVTDDGLKGEVVGNVLNALSVLVQPRAVERKIVGWNEGELGVWYARERFEMSMQGRQGYGEEGGRGGKVNESGGGGLGEGDLVASWPCYARHRERKSLLSGIEDACSTVRGEDG